MATLNGTTGDDILLGTPGDDTFNPLTGADEIDGEAGIDTLNIDNSTDAADTTITYTDVVDGGTITGGSNDGTIFENIELVNLTTGSGNDTITISAIRSDDTVNTGAGNDTINAGLGAADNVNGGAGNDLLIIDYSVGDTGSRMQLDGSSGTGLAARYLTGSLTTLDRIDFRNIEQFNVTGTSKDDIITTGAGNDTITGGAGNDTINGGAGSDIINAGDGDDSVSTDSSNDTIDGGAGNDKLNLNLSNQTIALNITNYQTAGINLAGLVSATNFESFNISTGSGDDNVIQAGIVNGTVIRSDDTINTGAGNDTINAGLGATDNVNDIKT